MIFFYWAFLFAVLQCFKLHPRYVDVESNFYFTINIFGNHIVTVLNFIPATQVRSLIYSLILVSPGVRFWFYNECYLLQEPILHLWVKCCNLSSGQTSFGTATIHMPLKIDFNSTFHLDGVCKPWNWCKAKRVSIYLFFGSSLFWQ